MFSKSAKYYDDIYLGMEKDYVVEASEIHAVIQQHKQTTKDSLLDVACRTSLHIGSLIGHYQCQRLDLDKNMPGRTCVKFSCPCEELPIRQHHFGIISRLCSEEWQSEHNAPYRKLVPYRDMRENSQLIRTISSQST